MRLTRTSRADSEGARPIERAWPEAIASSTLPAALLSPDRSIAESSEGLIRLTGFTRSELAGMPLLRLFEKDQARTDAGRSGWLLTKRRGKVPVAAYLSEAPGLSLAAFHPLENEMALEKELKAAMERLAARERYIEDFRTGVFRMITDLDRSESELKGALERLGETRMQLMQSSKMTALGELAAGLAHEVSQPLTVIKGLSLSMLRSFQHGSPYFEKLSLVAEASKKMESIVKHLRAFTRSEPPVMKPVDLNSVVRDAFLILSETLNSHSIETEMELREIPAVSGDPNRLEQVIINLVANAKDAMPRGGTLRVSTGMVEISGSRHARLIVEDTGEGIPGELIGKIFDPFVTTKEAGKGTGLGLSITSGIIKEHRGEISVESERGRGTAFTITIPSG
ncbi:MAG: hypothetical protein H3C68_05265 [Deltaproteobacteria bacterium]|nr:hypothetical protein [Deltaproteobacteria bacterium]MBZ0220138.1 hypothetical protein [Deltaproteobacteria bacterium]